MEASAQPVAKAEIPLDEETRQRIARDLGLDESQLDAVPKNLSIARYEVDDQQLEDDVSGFLFNTLSPTISTSPQLGGLTIGKIPGGLLVPL
jgi:hypothetical protein